MSKKPNKFLIKFCLLCDVQTEYMCDGFPYWNRLVFEWFSRWISSKLDFRNQNKSFSAHLNKLAICFFISFGQRKKNLKELPDLVYIKFVKYPDKIFWDYVEYIAKQNCKANTLKN